MLNPEFGLLELYIRDPKGRVRPYRPLFKLCGEAQHKELPPGEKLYESVFLAYGAGGFYFEEPGEYQIWAVYGAGGLRLRSNALRLRVAFPQKPEEEEMALLTFEQDQGHVLYMRGAAHLNQANDQLREVAAKFPQTGLSHYIHFCFGYSQARGFKDLVTGQVQPPKLEEAEAAKQLTEASKLVVMERKQQSLLDNITHGQAVDLLKDIYTRMEAPEQAVEVLEKTVRYFKRMEVKKEVIADLQDTAKAISLEREA